MGQNSSRVHGSLHDDHSRHDGESGNGADSRRQIQDGEPATEKGRKPDEGPQFEVVVEPFWMGKYPVTWAEYRLFMNLDR